MPDWLVKILAEEGYLGDERMLRQRIGATEFQDLQLGTRAQVVITRTREDKRTNMFVDLDVAGRGVAGAGDCEIGLDNENAKRVLDLFRQAIAVPQRDAHRGSASARLNSLGATSQNRARTRVRSSSSRMAPRRGW